MSVDVLSSKLAVALFRLVCPRVLQHIRRTQNIPNAGCFIITTMQTSSTTQHGPRNNSTHGAKRKVLGSAANHVPPAWRPNIAAQQAAAAKKISEAQGSKIFISSLPNDVQQTEVEVRV